MFKFIKSLFQLPPLESERLLKEKPLSGKLINDVHPPHSELEMYPGVPTAIAGGQSNVITAGDFCIGAGWENEIEVDR